MSKFGKMKHWTAACCALLSSSVLAKDYFLSDGGDLEGTLATAKSEYDAMATKEPSVIVLDQGTYTLTREMYLDWPVTIVGATGNPDDVVIDAGKKFRVCTINHADAEVKDLTIANGHFANESGIYAWGNAGVRICKPTSLDRANKNWDACVKGDGGKLTHCVVRDCETQLFLGWGIVYLNGPKESTVVDRCIIRNNNYDGQQNSSPKHGDIVEVASGSFRNSLVCDNTSTFGYAGSFPAADAYQGCVTVTGSDGEIVGCTVVKNTQKKYPGHQIAGVYAFAGKVVNTVIAYNTFVKGDSGYVTPMSPEHYAWGGVSDCFVNCVVDVATVPNETCVFAADPGFVDAAAGNYSIVRDGPCYNAGTVDAVCEFGTFDLAGRARVRTVGAARQIDVGAYQQDPTTTTQSAACTLPAVLFDNAAIRCEATVSGFGSEPVFYWDFNADGVADLVTREPMAECVLGLGSYDVQLTISNLVDCVGKTVAAENGRFEVTPHPVHYVDVNCKNPVSPYDTPETAATDIQTAIDASEPGHEVRIFPGDYPISKQIVVNKDYLIVDGATGNPDDVVIRAVTATNRCMMVNAGPHAIVHSLTLANGGSGPGTPISKDYCSTLAGGLCLANVGLNNAGDTAVGPHLGGTVSNCVVRGASVGAKFCQSCGVYAEGQYAFLTHCVISNNTNGGGAMDGGNFGAAGLALRGGARAENCLIAGNKTLAKWTDGYYQAAVTVGADSILRFSTVVGNSCAMVGGVNVYGTGRCEDCVIAGNSVNQTDTTNPRHNVWGAFPLGNYNRSKNGENIANEELRAETIGLQFTTNAVDMSGSGLGAGTIETTADRLIKNVGSRDYRLPRGSPAIDVIPRESAGIMASQDLYGNPRCSGGLYDCGANERPRRGLSILVR